MLGEENTRHVTGHSGQGQRGYLKRCRAGLQARAAWNRVPGAGRGRLGAVDSQRKGPVLGVYRTRLAICQSGCGQVSLRVLFEYSFYFESNGKPLKRVL